METNCPKCDTSNPSDSKFCKECATPLPSSKEIPVTKTLETPIEELTTGSTFAGRYQIIEELGKGGMGKVYKALDTDLKEKVAIKLIKPEVAIDKKTIERFRNELKFARKIRHKNVCQMYDLNREEGTHYITMEYVHGEDLKRLIRKMGQMSAGQVISIAMQVCEGMAEAHRLGVVHRDMKPQNVMVDEEGNARIMDFGIARSVKGKGITGAGVMIGTPEYMSPEQVEGKESDQRSDIYSLGIILYEMVTGRVPFEGDTPFTIGVKHKSEAPRNPKELNSQIPDDLSRVILRCIEKDKEQRYQSAGEVRSELENIEKGIPTTEKVIPKRKPITSKEITVTFGLKKLLIPALVVIAIAIIVAVIWQPWSQKETVPILQDKPSLAIMYFQNNTGDQSLDIWRDGLSRMLIADLSQSKYIRVVPDDQLYGILSQLNLLEANNYSTDNLKEVANRGKSTHILRGILTKSGDSFRINTTLQESIAMEIIGSEMVEGKGEGSLHSMVDELTRKIKESFELSEEEISSDIDKTVGAITTRSPEAYKYYIEGVKYYHTGKYTKSIPLIEKALSLDPEFGMAYRTLAKNHDNLGHFDEARKYLQRAIELRDRIPDIEYYRILGDFYGLSENTYDKAIEAFKKLLQLYPDDWIGNNYLGNVYQDLEEWDKAIEHYNVNIENRVEAFQSYYNIATPYMAKGLYDKAKEVCEYYRNNFTDNYFMHRSLVVNYLCQRKYNLAVDEANKWLSVNPLSYFMSNMKGDIYLCQGDLIKAEIEYKRCFEAELEVTHMTGRRRLAFLYLLQGKFEKCEDQAKLGLEMAAKYNEIVRKAGFHSILGYLYMKSGKPNQAIEEWNKEWQIGVENKRLYHQRVALWMKGLTYSEMSLLEEAQRTADEYKELIEKGMNRKLLRYYYDLMGMIELKKENYPKAIEYFNQSVSLLPYQNRVFFHHVLLVDHLALAYYESGDLEKAREEYERVTLLTIGRLRYCDLFAKAFYMLGKIYEQQGNRAKAIEHYEKFLSLWKNADPGIAEVKDARKRLVGLKS